MNRRIWAGVFLALLVAASAVPNSAAGPQTNQAVKKPVNQANTTNPGLFLLRPDLKIKKIWFGKWVENPNITPPVPITGDLKQGVKVWMVCDLANEGPGDVKGLWILGFYIDGVMMWNNSWGDLAAGKPLRGLGPYTPTTLGIHNFKCTLDVNDTIKETHEDNNNLEVLFKVVK